MSKSRYEMLRRAVETIDTDFTCEEVTQKLLKMFPRNAMTKLEVCGMLRSAPFIQRVGYTQVVSATGTGAKVRVYRTNLYVNKRKP